VLLSKTEKLIRVAVIEGNLTMAKLIRLLQPMDGGLAATDGNAIYVSDKFWELPLDQQYFIVNHEFLHIILNHVERSKGKDKYIYNLAGDVIVNDLLCKRGRRMPKGAITYKSLEVPSDFKTTEQIYDYLLKNAKNLDPNPDFNQDLTKDIKEKANKEVTQEIKKLADTEINQSYKNAAILEKIIPPTQDIRQVSWFDKLIVEIGRLALKTNEKTYSRPPRVEVKGCIMRGGYIKQYIPKINIIIDVSSSMGDEPLKIAAKINAAKQKLKIFLPKYFWLNTFFGEITDISKIPLGGGTDLSNVLKISGADLNVLITDCEDEGGIDKINKSTNRLFVITTNSQTKLKNTQSHKIILINNF